MEYKEILPILISALYSIVKYSAFLSWTIYQMLMLSSLSPKEAEKSHKLMIRSTWVMLVGFVILTILINIKL